MKRLIILVSLMIPFLVNGQTKVTLGTGSKTVIENIKGSGQIDFDLYLPAIKPSGNDTVLLYVDNTGKVRAMTKAIFQGWNPGGSGGSPTQNLFDVLSLGSQATLTGTNPTIKMEVKPAGNSSALLLVNRTTSKLQATTANGLLINSIGATTAEASMISFDANGGGNVIAKVTPTKFIVQKTDSNGTDVVTFITPSDEHSGIRTLVTREKLREGINSLLVIDTLTANIITGRFGALFFTKLAYLETRTGNANNYVNYQTFIGNDSGFITINNYKDINVAAVKTLNLTSKLINIAADSVSISAGNILMPGKATIKKVKRSDLPPQYTDNADAILNGLLPGDEYMTGDFLKLVH